MKEEIQSIPLHETTRRRYLTYALSVIQSRALPDVRDGLKPVQRRILFTMYRDLHLLHNRHSRKSAAVVGDVLGHYHPHGDQAVYDSLVRMAQEFSMRYPLIEGIGNFGSLDGDPPAAYRYTECRLARIAEQLLSELSQQTVALRATFDGEGDEPLVLPARFPNLIVNGTTGIAVGMATSIPPHNLKETAKACAALIDDPDLTVSQLLRYIKGPDFPTRGEILETKRELREIYESGSGALRIQGQYNIVKGKRGADNIIITSVPYQSNKATIVGEIGRIIAERKLPQLLDVRDESTDQVRVVIELKRGADPELVMAYLYRHTGLRSRFNVNLTALVPDDSRETVVPRRSNLKEMLNYFLQWRFEVLKRRLEYRLRLLQERIHLLKGFKKIFASLSEAINIIRRSNGRSDAAAKLKKRFRLDDEQVNAILETRLYKLARMEIKKILDELASKQKEADRIERLLKRPKRRWQLVKKELQEMADEFGDARLTKIGAAPTQEFAFTSEDFIADEDAFVVVTRDGWIKRLGRISDPGKIRLRQGDELLDIVTGNTKSVVVFFSSMGSAYSMRINDVPPKRGYGDPIQSLCRFRDGERIVAVISLDERVTEGIQQPKGNKKHPPLHGVAVSTGGYGLRFSLESFLEVSTKTGRRFAKLKKGEEVAGVEFINGDEILCCATRNGKALLCRVKEISFLSGPGRGVKVMDLANQDRLLGFTTTSYKTKGLSVVSPGGRKLDITPAKYRLTSRGGRGFPLTKRTGLTEVVRYKPSIPELPPKSEDNGE